MSSTLQQIWLFDKQVLGKENANEQRKNANRESNKQKISKVTMQAKEAT